MRKFNYFYFGTPVTKSQFESEVPENWQDEVDELGEYSWGGYRATEIDWNEE